MNYRVITEPQAERDLHEAAGWIAEDSPLYAAKWLQRMEVAIFSLTWSPHRFGRAPEADLFQREIRQLIHGNYRILFTIRDDAVHVLHIRHGARDYLRPDGPEAIDESS